MNQSGDYLIDPELSFRLCLAMGWVMIILGVLKMIIWIVGEAKPDLYKNVKSNSVRKFLTGTGNRLVFGLLGFVTFLIGIAAIGIAYFIRTLTQII